jgi:hypothetical protein
MCTFTATRRGERLSAAAVISALLLTLALGACDSLPKAASVTDPRAVHAWTAPACPSEAAQAKPAFIAPLLGALATPVLTDLVSGIVGIPVSALQAAASADKNGFAATGQSPRYFFPKATTTKDEAAKTATYSFTVPGCYIIAYTKYVAASGDPSAAVWCNDAGFSAALPNACSTLGKQRLGALLPGVGFPDKFAPAVPDFYAEIKLSPSNYTTATQQVSVPRVIALYYPHSLLERDSTKPRTLTLTIAMTSGVSAGTTDITKSASAGVVLLDVVPAAKLPPESLVAQQSSWIALPSSLKIASGDPVPDGGPYYPVNISATVKEIGDPNAFLQAFATAVASSAPDYTKAIVNAISPTAIAAAQQQAVTNSAAYLTASAQAATDLGKYLAACSPKPSTPAAIATANGLYQTVLADRQKANAAAMVAGISPPFSPLTQGLNKCFPG